jgi:hypothetical protein
MSINVEDLTPAQRKEFMRRTNILKCKWLTEHPRADAVPPAVVRALFAKAEAGITKYSPDQERDEGGRFAGDGVGGGASGAEKAKTQTDFYTVSHGDKKDHFFFQRDAKAFARKTPGSKVTPSPLKGAGLFEISRMEQNLGLTRSDRLTTTQQDARVPENQAAMTRLSRMYTRLDKYSPDQSRDEKGQFGEGGGGGGKADAVSAAKAKYQLSEKDGKRLDKEMKAWRKESKGFKPADEKKMAGRIAREMKQEEKMRAKFNEWSRSSAGARAHRDTGDSPGYLSPEDRPNSGWKGGK